MNADGMTQKMSPGERSTADAMWKGFRCRCPHCGKGRLFRSFLKPVETCERCGEWLDGHRSDDLPPYVTIMIVGHLVVPIILGIEMGLNPWPLWVYFAVFLPGTLVGMLLLMQPVKGAIIGLQWGLRLHGFDARGDYHSQRLPARGPTGDR
jgi:uncharacterized protein (DUF983 family)